MAYEPQEWRNDDPATPLSAERMAHIEQGVDAAHQFVDDLPPVSRLPDPDVIVRRHPDGGIQINEPQFGSDPATMNFVNQAISDALAPLVTRIEALENGGTPPDDPPAE